MNQKLNEISVSEFTRRIIERGGSGNWFLLVATDEKPAQLAAQIAYGLSREEENVVEVDSPANTDDVVRLARKKSTLVLAGLDEWPPSEWARWDVVRSCLLPSHRVAIVLSNDAATRLFRDAPHFIRLFTGSAWQVQSEIESPNEEERTRMIDAFERWAGISTAEMIRRAESRELPTDPEYVDWLVLAGRSDLL